VSFANTTVVLYGAALIAVFLLVSLATKEKTERGRLFLFWGMSSVIIFVTLFLTLDTIFENRASVTKGPVHWHADFQISVCGKSPDVETAAPDEGHDDGHSEGEDEHREVDLKDPDGLANRIGSPLLHEHGDGRIHIEGTVADLSDVTLAKFIESTGGEMSGDSLTLPTNEGVLTLENGQACPDGSRGEIQVFRYRTEGNLVFQDKLADFPNYVISPHAVIPPGDCLILEFTEPKEKTDRICGFYQIALDKGDLEYGN